MQIWLPSFCWFLLLHMAEKSLVLARRLLKACLSCVFPSIVAQLSNVVFLWQGIVTKLAQTVSGKVNNAMPGSQSNSRSNSRTRKVTSTSRGTELEEFEDARSEFGRASGSLDSMSGAQPMVAQQ